jgi:hypothetical protein
VTAVGCGGGTCRKVYFEVQKGNKILYICGRCEPVSRMESRHAVPVIFLDVDGVCHPLAPSGHALFADMKALTLRAEQELDLPEDAEGAVVPGEFTDDCMRALSGCIGQLGSVRIVLSSTWRETAPQRRAVNRQLRLHGLPEAVGCTPISGGGRAAEILSWVEQSSPRPVRWVAIDDHELVLPDGCFVRTDPAKGFTEQDALRVCQLLER